MVGMTMQVMEKQCDECLFSNNRIVSESRKKELLEKCNRTGRAFDCHKATLLKQQIVCRAFFDGNHSLAVRLAKLLGCAEFVTLPEEKGVKHV